MVRAASCAASRHVVAPVEAIGWIGRGHGATRTALGTRSCRSPQPLSHYLAREIIDAGRIAARPGEAGDDPEQDRVFADAEDNRDCRCCSFGCASLAASLLAGVAITATRRWTKSATSAGRRSFLLVLQPWVFDPHVLAFDVTRCAQAFAKRGHIPRRRHRPTRHGETRLLAAPGVARAASGQGNCRAAEQRDELAPSHSITSSARTSSVDGTSKPRALAVLRLMTVWYLVGAWTGRSAGLAPRKIRST